MREGHFLISSVDKSIDDFARFDIQFATGDYSDALYQNLGIHFPDMLHRAVVKKKAEYLAGRYATKQGLAKLGENSSRSQTDFHLNNGIHRAPKWPFGYIGSITHTRDIACAVVARTDKYRAIGIDIEQWFTQDSFDKVKTQFLTEQDKDVMLTSRSLEAFKIGTLIFSAKESLFKALYPTVGQYFDFQDAAVTEIHLDSESLIIELQRSLGPAELVQNKRRFKVAFKFNSHYVSTQLLLKNNIEYQ